MKINFKLKSIFLTLILFITILSCDDRETVTRDTLECGVTEHEESGECVSNHKMVECIDVTPNNATLSNIKTEITWENGIWTEAINCEWECNTNYIKSGENCISISENDVSNIRVENITDHSCDVLWDGNPNAKTWLFVHSTQTTGQIHDASNNKYTYPSLGSDITFTAYVQGVNSDLVLEKDFTTLDSVVSCKDNSCIEEHRGVCSVEDSELVCSCDGGYHLEEETCVINDEDFIIIKKIGQTEILFTEATSVDNSRMIVDNTKGIYLSNDSNIEENIDNDNAFAEINYKVKAEEEGVYWISTISSLNDLGVQRLTGTTSKYDSLFMKIEVKGDENTEKKVNRVIYVPWAIDRENYKSKLDRFYFNGNIQDINIWLPKGVVLNTIIVEKYIPPTIPDEAEDYVPTIIPETRPRLWINPSSYLSVKNNLNIGRNQAIWEYVESTALTLYEYPYLEGESIIKADTNLEAIMQYKAFYYLMENDAVIGREAIDISKKYIKELDFGNILDVTRPVGHAIYISSLIYDWCYDLLTEDEKILFVDKFKYLAESMEIGWPPFRQAITVGHGSEEQLSKYLLAMSIAIYDEDPLPYKYASYRVLEELSPMRKFEYQSPRHHQGMSYGPVRYKADLEAALLFKKMSGIEVFDTNIKNIYKSFFYRRLTNKKFFNDGDNFSQYYSGNIYYGLASLAYYGYVKDSSENNFLELAKLVKGDIALRSYAAFNSYKVLTLLLNDPNMEVILPNETGLSSLPLTMFTGKIIGSMIARTGWNMNDDTNDVVVDIKGGGYFFVNHQHADAGSFQIFYRGAQIVDLGQYHYYGTPYDYEFNKRSIAHSMMLAIDPDENINDGGTRKISGSPVSQEYIENNIDKYRNGEIISESIEPKTLTPDFSYYSVDLTSSYSDKLERYQRSSVFINLKNENTPAVLILLDKMKTSNVNFKKYWQINTLNAPEIDNNGVITLSNSILDNEEGNIIVNMLSPSVNNREINILSGSESTTVFGTHYDPPKPEEAEANGTRIMISPLNSNIEDVFLTVFTMKTPSSPSLEINYVNSSDDKSFHILVGSNILVVMNKTDTLLETNINMHINIDNTKLLISGLKDGNWNLSGNNMDENIIVEEGKNTVFFNIINSGDYILSKI